MKARWYLWPFFRAISVPADPLPVRLPAGDLEMTVAVRPPSFWVQVPNGGLALVSPETSIVYRVATRYAPWGITWLGAPSGAVIQSIKANGVNMLAAPMPCDVFGPVSVLTPRRWCAWLFRLFRRERE